MRQVLSYPRCDAVVPLAMEFIGLEVHMSQFLIADLDPCLIGVRVQHRTHRQTRPRCRRCDQTHNRLPADQWLPTPVLRDVAKQPVLHLVPLARPRREVADVQREPQLVCQPLQRHLPQPRPHHR